MKRKQRGVALLVAMLIIAIATIVATQIFYQQQITIRRTSNQLQAEQLYQLALSSEQWVKVILKEDLKTNNFDYLGDTWAKPISLPINEGATVKIDIKITDAQSCFNINNLVLNGKTAQPEQIKILRTLMTQLKLNPDLVWTLVDWLDNDDEPNSNGAEFETYSRLTPAYRSANFRILELNELYAVSGWNSATVNALVPYICALQPAPSLNKVGRFFVNSTELSKINVNTASERVLRSLLPEMRDTNLMNILEMRKKTPFKSIADFWTQFDKDNSSFWTQFTKDNTKNPDAKTASKATLTLLLTVNSEYFFMEYSALLDQFEQHYRSLIYRPGNASATNTAASKTTPMANTAAADGDAPPPTPSDAQADVVATDIAATNTNTSTTPNAIPNTNATTNINSNSNTTTTNNISSSTQSGTNINQPLNIANSANTQINTLYRLQYY
jgi:general secretion pathway protein K